MANAATNAENVIVKMRLHCLCVVLLQLCLSVKRDFKIKPTDVYIYKEKKELTEY